MGKALEELAAAVRDVAGVAGPAVVGVGPGGSGVVIGEGLVVTNAHNLRGEQVSVTFTDGRREAAEVAGADIDGDLAVLKVATTGVTPLTFAEAEPGPGDAVLALGNPGGRGTRVTVGFVSAVGVAFRGPRGGRIRGAIEHTAPLARGSSGGPVVDVGGRLLGLNTHRLGDGFYLAVPADAALRARVEALGRGEVPVRPRLGIAVAPLQVARRLRRSVGLPERSGILVQAVEEGGPADRGGISPGDLIVRIGASEVASVDELASALEAHAAGGSGPEPLEVGLVRGAEELVVTVDLLGAPPAG
jgi:serine protease Do